METSRNEAILDGVATTFIEAVLQFCNHPNLQYQWLKYIPQIVPEPFWMKLVNKIHELLQIKNILRGRSKGPLRRLDELKIVRNDFKDRFGNPLVSDLPEELYLASEYDVADLAVLEILGLKTMSWRDIAERFHRDLNSFSSKLKSIATDDEWHTRAAYCLRRLLCCQKWPRSIELIRNSRLIPLQNGQWTSANDGKIVFSRTEGMLIPTDLGLQVIDEKAIENLSRRKLFVKLGLTSASVESVRKLILQRYKLALCLSPQQLALEISKSHIWYLYWTHSLTATSLLLREETALLLFNHRGDIVDSEEDLYFSTGDEYGFKKLVGSVLDEPSYRQSRIGSFIHPDYLKFIAPKSSFIHPKFETWLEDCLGILRQPRLVNPEDPEELSAVFDYLVEHRPEKLLGTLRAHWNSYSKLINPEICAEIMEVKVDCTEVGLTALDETFLPSKDLMTKCKKFLDVQKFPFLKIEDESSPDDWKFLKVFDVGVENTLNFYLQILHFSKLSDVSLRYEIYEEIQRKVWASSSPEEDKETVRFVSLYISLQINILFIRVLNNYHRNLVLKEKLILVPTCHGKPSTWVDVSNCLWDAPDYLTTKHALLPAFSSFNSPVFTAFFKDTLMVSDVSWSNLITELTAIKERDRPDIDVVHDIYHRLQEISLGLDLEDRRVLRWEAIRFDADKLHG
jgi:hypothetical protein